MENFLHFSYFSIPLLIAYFSVGWLYSFQTRVFSWLDFFWSTSFILLILSLFAFDFHFNRNSNLLYYLYLIWAIRLSFHLFKRIKAHGEDKRYLVLKQKWKVWYGIYFFLLFQLEGILTHLLVIPLFLDYQTKPSAVIFYLTLIVFAVAIIGESIADKQLKSFKKANPQEVCNVGLWKYSRHPNYFFEWLIWLSFAIFSFSATTSWPGLIPAIVMYLLLTKVTGIPPAEASSLQSRGNKYRKYQETTSIFFPWFNKKILITLVILSATFSTYSALAKGNEMLQQEKIKNVFSSLNANNTNILDDFYDKNTHFIDPIGEHQGINEVKNYYKNLYTNVENIKFDFLDLVTNGSTHVLVWKMTLVTKKLNNGKPIIVFGTSHIKFNDQDLVIYHRDYFDMGEFIYENVPFLGWTIKKIKERLKDK